MDYNRTIRPVLNIEKEREIATLSRSCTKTSLLPGVSYLIGPLKDSFLSGSGEAISTKNKGRYHLYPLTCLYENRYNLLPFLKIHVKKKIASYSNPKVDIIYRLGRYLRRYNSPAKTDPPSISASDHIPTTLTDLVNLSDIVSAMFFVLGQSYRYFFSQSSELISQPFNITREKS